MTNVFRNDSNRTPPSLPRGINGLCARTQAVTLATCAKAVEPPAQGRGRCRVRSGAALLMAIFVMTVTTMLVLMICDTQTIQYAALRNTIDYDRARYLAEAGVQHALALLETNIDWRGTIANTEYPAGSGEYYTVTVSTGTGASVSISSTGIARDFSRTLNAVIKQGG